MTLRTNTQKGFILVTVLFTTVFIMVMGVVSLQLISSNLNTAKKEQYLVNAQFSADAGIDDAIRQLNLNDSWTGTGSELTLYTTAAFKSTYTTVVTAGSDSLQKFISVTARTYAPATSSTPKYVRKYTVEMRGVTGGDYSVVTGVGGLEMSNSAKIVGGNVFVNGSITMSNNSQIGLSTKPVNVKAAHQNCPVPATALYPKVCATNENGQPISLNNSAKIYGEVQATNQTNGSGMTSPGLVTGNPAPASLPDYDRFGQITAVTNTLNGNFNCSSGTYSWPANYKISGSVNISNTCQVTVNGNVWVTGTLNMSNSSKMIVSNALGATKPIIMVDGQQVVFSNSAVLQSNIIKTGFRILAYWSKAACSVAVAACDVTGTDLYNSRDQTTISLSNNTEGAQTEFYARWTKIDVNNAGNIGALVGQTVSLSNAGAVTFGSTVSGAGGVEAWVVKSYKRTF